MPLLDIVIVDSNVDSIVEKATVAYDGWEEKTDALPSLEIRTRVFFKDGIYSIRVKDVVFDQCTFRRYEESKGVIKYIADNYTYTIL